MGTVAQPAAAVSLEVHDAVIEPLVDDVADGGDEVADPGGAA